jgi:hypothetical protein
MMHWKTVFYRDARDKSCFVVLDYTNKIIDNHDINAGHIPMEKLLRTHGHKIRETDIGDNSCILEYTTARYIDDMGWMYNKNVEMTKQTCHLTVK